MPDTSWLVLPSLDALAIRSAVRQHPATKGSKPRVEGWKEYDQVQISDFEPLLAWHT